MHAHVVYRLPVVTHAVDAISRMPTVHDHAVDVAQEAKFAKQLEMSKQNCKFRRRNR
jgi:hypothetical protein